MTIWGFCLLIVPHFGLGSCCRAPSASIPPGAGCSALLLGALTNTLVSKFSSVFLRSPRQGDSDPIPVSPSVHYWDSARRSRPISPQQGAAQTLLPRAWSIQTLLEPPPGPELLRCPRAVSPGCPSAVFQGCVPRLQDPGSPLKTNFLHIFHPRVLRVWS